MVDARWEYVEGVVSEHVNATKRDAYSQAIKLFPGLSADSDINCPKTRKALKDWAVNILQAVREEKFDSLLFKEVVDEVLQTLKLGHDKEEQSAKLAAFKRIVQTASDHGAGDKRQHRDKELEAAAREASGGVFDLLLRDTDLQSGSACSQLACLGHAAETLRFQDKNHGRSSKSLNSALPHSLFKTGMQKQAQTASLAITPAAIQLMHIAVEQLLKADVQSLSTMAKKARRVKIDISDIADLDKVTKHRFRESPSQPDNPKALSTKADLYPMPDKRLQKFMGATGAAATRQALPHIRARWCDLMQRMVKWSADGCGGEICASDVIKSFRAEAWHYAGYADLSKA